MALQEHCKHEAQKGVLQLVCFVKRLVLSLLLPFSWPTKMDANKGDGTVKAGRFVAKAPFNTLAST